MVQEFERPIRFSTDDLSEAEGLAIWRETFGRSIVKMEMAPIGSGVFRSEAKIYPMPNLTIAAVTSTPNRVTRTRALAADGSDDVVLGVMLAGQAITRQSSREVTIRAGEAVLWSNAELGEGIYPASIDFLTVAMSRGVLAQTVVNLDDALMRFVPEDNQALRLLIRYVRIITGEIGAMSPQLMAASSAHVQDLVAMALGATRDATELAQGRGVRAARLQAIRTDVLANLTRRDLSIDMLAVRHGISPRYIRSLFDSEATTFTDFVLRERLARAHKCLLDRRFDGHMISTIAFECGFGDLSYFNLAFRRRYGATPSEVRASADRTDDGTR